MQAHYVDERGDDNHCSFSHEQLQGVQALPILPSYLEKEMVENVDTFSYGLVLALSEDQFIVNKSGFTGLINSGVIDKIPVNLAEKLYQYYFLVDDINRIETKYNTFCEEIEVNIYLHEGIVGGLIDIMYGDHWANVPLHTSPSPAPLDAIFTRGPYDVNQILSKYQELVLLGQELLNEFGEGI